MRSVYFGGGFWRRGEVRGVNEVADFIERKREIGAAFQNAAPPPYEANAAYYRALLDCMGVRSTQDRSILCAFVRDAVMAARREGRFDPALRAFLDWLEFELANGD